MISKLPYLAQIKALKQMETFELFFLGLCSRKTKSIIQKVCHKINATVIDLVNSCLKIDKLGPRSRNVLMWSFYGQPKTANLENSFWNGRIELKFKEHKIQCKISSHPTNGIPILWCEEKYQKVLPLAIHNSICDVFNASPIIQIGFKISELSKFPEIDTVDNICEWGSQINTPDSYSSFFERFNIKNCAQINPGYHQKVDIDSKLLSINHLSSCFSNWVTREHLMKFQGISAVFHDAVSLKSEDLIAFLNDWLNGKNTKLESMIITTFMQNAFDKNTILKDFETIPWDPKKRGGRFKYPSSTIRLSFDHDALDCTQQVDIERKSDGLLGTVFIDEGKFRFFVWHNRFPDTSIDQQVTSKWRNKTLYWLGDIFL